ncbi:MAG: fibronectin type III domain-containing protein [Thermoguttaceae bacterium]|nr:fibronectin type III domain-containing protein [Thermoguttaceae bacterium]
MAERRPFRKLSVEALESRLVLSSAQVAPESLADAVSAQISSFAPELARVDLSAIGDGSYARLAVELVGSPAARWQISWGDGETTTVDALGYSLVDAHFYPSLTAANYDVSLTVYSSPADADGATFSLGSVRTSGADSAAASLAALETEGGSDGAEDAYEFAYELHTSGPVRVLGQTGVQRSSMTYCDVTDPVYLELWEKAIARWEEVITVGAEDIDYPYTVDGELVSIDDIFLYFGFSDSYSSESSLGSALNSGYYRDGGQGLAATGSLVFNAKYFVASPSEQVQNVFYNVALHEIAHSLGYNISRMSARGLIESVREKPWGLDGILTSSSYFWYYVGENGVAQYRATFPANFTVVVPGDSYPMETYTANGSFGAHPSSALGTYYLYINQRDGMNYAISPTFEATITATTLGVLEDLGYSVDYGYADPFGSPAPEGLVAEATEGGALLTWKKSLGDLSNASSGDATYQIERRGIGDLEWRAVAVGVEGTSYLDADVEPYSRYEYRVRALNVRSNEEVGVYLAEPGETISWESDASRFCVYALQNKGSDKLAWTRVVSSMAQKSWTVTEDAPTLYRVVAIGVILDETAPSRAAAVEIGEIAGPAPDFEASPGAALTAFATVRGGYVQLDGITVANVGNGAGACSVQIYAAQVDSSDADDVLIGEIAVGVLEANESRALQPSRLATEKLDPGARYRLFWEIVGEADSDESNNTGFVSNYLEIFGEAEISPQNAFEKESYAAQYDSSYRLAVTESGDNYAYWYDFGAGYYVEGDAENWVSPKDYGLTPGEYALAVSVVDRASKRVVAKGSAALRVDEVGPSFFIASDGLEDDSWLRLTLTSDRNPIAIWEIDWGDETPTRIEENAFSVNASHFYEQSSSETGRFVTITVYSDPDSEGESFCVFCAWIPAGDSLSDGV